MRKKTTQKVTIMLVFILMMSVMTVSAIPRWSTLATTYNSLNMYSSGKMHCEADTAVQYGHGYIAGLRVELQQNNGGWTTIKTWSAEADDYVDVVEDWYVYRGYYYRLKLTHTARSSSGVLLETFEDYSVTIPYF